MQAKHLKSLTHIPTLKTISKYGYWFMGNNVDKI